MASRVDHWYNYTMRPRREDWSPRGPCPPDAMYWSLSSWCHVYIPQIPFHRFHSLCSLYFSLHLIIGFMGHAGHTFTDPTLSLIHIYGSPLVSSMYISLPLITGFMGCPYTDPTLVSSIYIFYFFYIFIYIYFFLFIFFLFLFFLF